MHNLVLLLVRRDLVKSVLNHFDSIRQPISDYCFFKQASKATAHSFPASTTTLVFLTNDLLLARIFMHGLHIQLNKHNFQKKFLVAPHRVFLLFSFYW
jgi:hypothetical protein